MTPSVKYNHQDTKCKMASSQPCPSKPQYGDCSLPRKVFDADDDECEGNIDECEGNIDDYDAKDDDLAQQRNR